MINPPKHQHFFHGLMRAAFRREKAEERQGARLPGIFQGIPERHGTADAVARQDGAQPFYHPPILPWAPESIQEFPRFPFLHLDKAISP
jgi:hypothetical protein